MNFKRKVRNIFSQWVRYFRISYIEAKATQSGAHLGVLWLPLSSIIFSIMLALVFKHSDEVSRFNFFLYVFSGYSLWGVVSDMFTKSVDVIQTKWDFAVHNKLTLPGLFAKQLSDKMFEYILNVICIFIIISIFSPAYLSASIFLFAPLIVLVSLTYISGAYIINILTIFYPDLKTLVRMGARFLFFVSPVFWIASGETDGIRSALVYYNPISYYLSLPRQAVGVEPVILWNWLIAGVMTCLITLSGWALYHYTNRFVRNLK